MEIKGIVQTVGTYDRYCRHEHNWPMEHDVSDHFSFSCPRCGTGALVIDVHMGTTTTVY